MNINTWCINVGRIGRWVFDACSVQRIRIFSVIDTISIRISHMRVGPQGKFFMI